VATEIQCEEGAKSIKYTFSSKRGKGRCEKKNSVAKAGMGEVLVCKPNNA
jgi:hypothetical protein